VSLSPCPAMVGGDQRVVELFLRLAGLEHRVRLRDLRRAGGDPDRLLVGQVASAVTLSW
jgi:hypothetical protein